MSKIKTQCPICGYTVKTEVAPTSCAQCGADYTRAGVEFVVDNSKAGFFTIGQKTGGPGHLILTNYRLFYIADKTSGNGAVLGGIAGALIENAINAHSQLSMTFCLPLNDIGDLTDTRAGIMKGLVVTSRAHGEIGKVTCPKRDEYRALVAQTVRQYAGR
jgi:hypothetical protein